MTSAATQTLAATTGELNFISRATQSSLYRNGCVLIERDASGNTASATGINMEKAILPVHNARAMPTEARPTCERNGFELRNAPLDDNSVDLRDHEAVVRRYYPACERLVARVTGARAYAFDHNVRSASGKQRGDRVSGGQDVQGPAQLVHGDYTLRSGPERLEQLSRPPSGNDTLLGILPDGQSTVPEEFAGDVWEQGRRFAIINVWRSITDEPVVTYPMALCDAQTVVPEELVVFEIHYADRVGENYFSKHSPNHVMYYYPQMTRDEALLIKQWDSAGPLARSGGEYGDASDPSAPCTFSFHSAFVDPSVAEDAPDRWSIEVRCMVIYG